MNVMGVGWGGVAMSTISKRSFDLHIFLNIKAKRTTWLIPKILKIEAKRTLLIQELAKVKAK